MSSRFVRNSLFGTIAGVSTTLGSFASSLIVARLLGVEATGAVAYVVWVVGVATTLTSLGLPFTLARYLPEMLGRGETQQAMRLAAYLFRPFLLASALPAIGFASYAGWLIVQHSDALAQFDPQTPLHDPMICGLVGLTCLAQALAEYARSYLRGMHAFSRVAKITSISMAAQLVALAIGSSLFGVRGAVGGYLCASLLPLLVLHEIWREPGKAAPDLKARIVTYARFRWASEILGFFIWSRIEVFFLQVFWGIQSIGLFTVGLTLANLAIQGPLMLTWGLLPHFSEQRGQNDVEAMRRVYATGTRLMAFLVFPACLGLAAVMPAVLTLLYGQAFAGAIPAATILVCAASISAVATVGTNLMWAMERSDVDFYVGLVGAVLSIAGGLLVIGHLGPMGAAYSRAATQLVAVGVSSWFLVRRLHFEIPIASLARLFAAAVLCAITARLCLDLVSGILGLLVAIGAGAATYLIAVRLLAALPPDDIARLRSVSRMMPGGLARAIDPAMRLILG
ncbi:lipopolysaccharide biosynthesis protein [Lichenihabitans psoromatis]|uniref:lipopolysaccharide biosynthesis protein n=1 Tax=Lichenihabitans psoromatis TaxID=2528642 RepID=UPI00103851F7|nr:lipopolysaccharide biosynthesis protein [Lichenihabitans psoromatis]